MAGDVLVPAGFGPQPLPHLCGAQLVGQRIRVYWRKDDEFYSGTVVAYDATRDDATGDDATRDVRTSLCACKIAAAVQCALRPTRSRTAAMTPAVPTAVCKARRDARQRGVGQAVCPWRQRVLEGSGRGGRN